MFYFYYNLFIWRNNGCKNEIFDFDNLVKSKKRRKKRGLIILTKEKVSKSSENLK